MQLRLHSYGYAPCATSCTSPNLNTKILKKLIISYLSRDTIYSRIEEKRLGGKLHQYLPRFGKTRWKGGKSRKDASVRQIPNRVDITKRPDIVEERVRLGDWEGDTVHGQDAHLVTLVDRTSRFTLVKRVFSKTKEEVSSAIIVMMSGVHTALTLTLDNGGEFAGHETITKKRKLMFFLLSLMPVGSVVQTKIQMVD